VTLLDPAERSARGAALQREITGHAAAPPRTLVEQSWRDFIYAEIWSRPGLDRRARTLIALSGAAISGSSADLAHYAHGALAAGILSLGELREAALHLAVYGGWSRAARFDEAATNAAAALGIAEPETPPIRATQWNPETRSQEGADEFRAVMTFPGGPPATPYLEAIRNFVFGEVWCRHDGLDQRARRWITLVGVCESTAEIPIRTHIHAAMASGNCSPAEMQEFVLQFAVHAGWPKASVIQGVVSEMSRKVAAGLPHDG
jgi:4-carboxymuconolactone decarboxylase